MTFDFPHIDVPGVDIPADEMKLICVGCGKTPEELDCYKPYLEDNETASEYVWEEEGTLNRNNGHFLCDSCYLVAGMPSSPSGWRAP